MLSSCWAGDLYAVASVPASILFESDVSDYLIRETMLSLIELRQAASIDADNIEPETTP